MAMLPNFHEGPFLGYPNARGVDPRAIPHTIHAGAVVRIGLPVPLEGFCALSVGGLIPLSH